MLDRLDDVDYPTAVLAVLVVVTVVGLLVAANTSTAAFGVYNPRWEGTSEFRSIADETETETSILRETTEYERLAGNGTLVMVLSPDSGYSPTDAARLEAFVRRGGTVLVAEDFGNHSNPLLADLGVSARLNGSLLRDGQFHYRAPALPVARNVSNDSLVDGVEEITLNYGTAVEPGEANVLIGTSDLSYIDANRNDELDDNETLRSYPVVTSERLGAGRVIVVGDPSVFINAMLERSGNRAFARRLLETHERVVFDYSHVDRLPPLAATLLTIRDSAILQLLIGGLGLAVILALEEGWRPITWVRERVSRRPDVASPGIGSEEMTAYLRRQHPEWDEERIERVVEGVMRNRDSEN